jgi:hypothetical protein
VGKGGSGSSTGPVKIEKIFYALPERIQKRITDDGQRKRGERSEAIYVPVVEIASELETVS